MIKISCAVASEAPSPCSVIAGNLGNLDGGGRIASIGCKAIDAGKGRQIEDYTHDRSMLIIAMRCSFIENNTRSVERF